MSGKRKAIILGFDGFDPGILERLMGEGRLPNFARLTDTGTFSPLQTVVPPQSPVAWTTIATGQEPGLHGVYDFLTREPGEYLPKSRILKQGKLGYVRPFPTKTFWELASENGIPSIILKWPLTFPAAPIKGALLTGLGTPDVRGTLGIYSFFTTRELADGIKKGIIRKVEITGDTIRTYITGPLMLSWGKDKEATLPLEIRLQDDHISCQVEGQTFKLRPGCWSPWISVGFKVGLMRTLTGMCRFYLESLRPDFSLYMTPVNISNQAKSLPISYPLGYARTLARTVGDFSTLGLAEDANALDDGLLSEQGFLSGCDNIIAERKNIFLHALENFREGILACVFDTSDRIQHMFWRCLDTTHPLHGDSQPEKYGGVIYDCYARMDGILGPVLDRFHDDALIVVCSDHGFASYQRSVHLNTWLHQHGFLALEHGGSEGAPLFDNVDWSRTTAFAFGLNSLCLNIRHREQQGALEPEKAEAVKQELAARLGPLTDHGNRVIRQIHDPAKLYGARLDGQAPDLIVCYEAGYRTSWQSALGEVPGPAVFEDNLRKWSGDHCCDPECVPGIFLSNEKNLLIRPTAHDISPAIMDYIL